MPTCHISITATSLSLMTKPTLHNILRDPCRDDSGSMTHCKSHNRYNSFHCGFQVSHHCKWRKVYDRLGLCIAVNFSFPLKKVCERFLEVL